MNTILKSPKSGVTSLENVQEEPMPAILQTLLQETFTPPWSLCQFVTNILAQRDTLLKEIAEQQHRLELLCTMIAIVEEHVRETNGN